MCHHSRHIREFRHHKEVQGSAFQHSSVLFVVENHQITYLGGSCVASGNTLCAAPDVFDKGNLGILILEGTPGDVIRGVNKCMECDLLGMDTAEGFSFEKPGKDEADFDPEVLEAEIERILKCELISFSYTLERLLHAKILASERKSAYQERGSVDNKSTDSQKGATSIEECRPPCLTGD